MDAAHWAPDPHNDIPIRADSAQKFIGALSHGVVIFLKYVFLKVRDH